jgi:two-component system cell cycle sensor histidine kinase/response regulator CckA
MEQISVMIVEDEGLIAIDIASQLSRNGYPVSGIAASGKEALAHLTHSHPDLILMDIKLKVDLDGIATATRIRAEHKIPVIFLTSHADTETIERAKHAEPCGYLVKPFRQVNLCSAIKIAVHKYRNDRALMEREAWLSSVLQATADATIVIDKHGLIRFLNPGAEKILRWTSRDAAGSSWPAVLPLFDPTGEVIGEEFLLNTSAGEHTNLPAGFTLRPCVGCEIAVEGEVSCCLVDGMWSGVIVTVRDVSARNEREVRLRHEQKMSALGRLAGGIAHDFNNLLTIIMGHAALLIEEIHESESRGRIAAVLDAANTAVGITTQLLTVSGSRVLDTELVDLNASIARLLTLVFPNGESKMVADLKLEPSLGLIQMNSAQCDSVTVATPNCDKVVVPEEGPASRPFVRLLIEDKGEGMSAEVRKHIFDPFFTTKDDAKGRGLGLSIVYGIVTDADGYVTAESTSGCGASFEVLLPRWEGVLDTGPAEPWCATAELQGSATILLAEDDPMIREMLQMYLEAHGFHVIVAGDGQAALHLATVYASRIDLLLSDVRMPLIDGVTLAKRMKLLRPQTKALLMSGYTGEHLQRERETFVFIQKPFAPPELLKIVQGLTVGVQGVSPATVCSSW